MSSKEMPGISRMGFFSRLTRPEDCSRRAFLQVCGATVAVLGVTGCSDDLVAPGAELGPNGEPRLFRVELGTGDVGVLNYAFALEQLEAAFYAIVISNRFAGMTEIEARTLIDIRDHEIAHREFLRAALGTGAIPNLLPDFRAVNFGNRESVLTTAQTFEDLGVAAYNGAGQLLQNPDFLLAAGKIVSVEARHASAIRHLQQPFSMYSVGEGSIDVVDSNGLDRAMTPSEVLSAAAPFLNNTIIATGLPTT